MAPATPAWEPSPVTLLGDAVHAVPATDGLGGNTALRASRHRAEIAAQFRARAEASGKHWTASADDHGHVTYLRPPDGTPRRTVERILAGA